MKFFFSREKARVLFMKNKRIDSATLGDRSTNDLARAIALEEGGLPSFSRQAMWLALVATVIFGIWAHFAKLDIITLATGQILPAGAVQVIQHLDGGRISEIFIDDGDSVQTGDVLISFNDTQARSKYQAMIGTYWALFAKAERLRAFSHQREPDFSSVPEEFSLLIEEEYILFETTLNQSRQLRQQVSTLGQIAKIRSGLARDQLVTRVEALDAEQALGQAQSDLLLFKRRSLDELNDTSDEISEIEEQIVDLEDRLNRMNVTSPVDGVVQELQFRTVGGVVPPGAALMNVVPVNDQLEAEIRVSPTDIGYVRTGQEVKIKVGTYDFMRYGTIAGIVQMVSPYSSVDEENTPFFRVIVALAEDYVARDPSKIVQPGMTVQVDIVTDQQSILAYLMRPIVVAFEQGMSER